MFTGIIQALGTIVAFSAHGSGALLRIESPDCEEWVIGESVAVNGCCLTVTRAEGHTFHADLSDETLRRTTFSHMKVGERVNLERALRISDRLGGHLVTGHMDGVGIVRGRRDIGTSIEMAIEIPGDLRRYLVHKGSIAVDGVSLTLTVSDAEKKAAIFTVTLIPHTAEHTTLGQKQLGDRVNIEVDYLAKIVESLGNYGQ